MQVHVATKTHPIPDGEVRLLGGVESVTGSMTMVETAGRRLLVDCGMAQGREARDWELSPEAVEADAVILTHGHTDHVGSLPELWRRGYKGPVFATRATLRIARAVIIDGLGIQRWRGRDISAFQKWFDASTTGVSYDELAGHVPGWDGKLAFREAGHILGSASVELVTSKSRVIISGDIGRHDSPLLRDPNLEWDGDRPVDLVLLESTYGNRTHEKTHDEIQARLFEHCLHAIERGGHMLVPAFAIGRTQVLLYHLNALVESGRLEGLPVAIDTPLGLRMTRKYQNFRKLWDEEALDLLAEGDDPLVFDDLYSVGRGRDSVRLRRTKGPMLIIAGSGMCTGGRIVGHLEELLPRPETMLLFVGYQARGTPGSYIQRAADSKEPTTARINGKEVVINAKVANLRGLSAHADRDELLDWLRAIPDVRRVALHHGERRAQEALARAIASELHAHHSRH